MADVTIDLMDADSIEATETVDATDERLIALSDRGFLAEVLGFETKEIAKTAKGTQVHTLSGLDLIDFTAGIAVHACGHGAEEIVEAVTRQAARIMHTSDVMLHAPQLQLGAALTELAECILPGSPWQTLLLNSGSESIDAAAKLALKATGRSKIIAFEGAFHGRTLFASALSRSKSLHWNAYEAFLAPLRANILHAPAPRCSGCELSRDICCANGLEALLDAHNDEIAAVFFEPVQGEGGYYPMSSTAARRIREITRERGILLIADEIQSGIGRTGKWFAFQHLGIDPDIIVFGKAVGGGLPLAGILARKDLMEKWTPGEHGTTFGGNPLACAAGFAAMKIIERDGLIENALQMGARIHEKLSPLIGSHGVADVRGRGLMMAIELRDSAGNPDYARCESVKLKCREKGLLLLTCGAKTGNPRTDSANIRIIPPLNVTLETMDNALSILTSSLAE